METPGHHAIIVSSWHKGQLKDAHQKAVRMFSKAFADEQGGTLVSNIVHGLVYPQSSFFIAPDGLEKHAGLYQNGKEVRKLFLEWLKEYKNYCSFLEVAFGSSKVQERIVRCNSWDISNAI